MKLSIEREGGVAGMTRRFEVETETLSAADRLHLEELLEAARFFDLPSRVETSSPGADRFLYRVTVESTDRRHTVEAGEAAPGSGLQSLIDEVRRLAGRKRPPA